MKHHLSMELIMYIFLKSKFLVIAASIAFFLFTIVFMAACQISETVKNDATAEIAGPAETAVIPETTAFVETITAETGEETGLTKEEELEETMKIESPVFKTNEMIPSRYTCDGQNINPQLNISGVPADARSLVLIVDDPDAPGGTWVHWTAWNIDPATGEIAEGSVPVGAVEGVTDFGVPGYGAPCPPSGTHHYFFKIYALDITLDLDSSATVTEVEQAMEGHMMGSAELIGLYSRS